MFNNSHKKATIPNLNHFFEQSIRWKTIESIGYHAILLTHQTALFYVMPATTYGLVGLVFSSIYLLEPIITSGIDATIGPFFTEVTHSKVQLKHFLKIQLLPNCFIFILLLLLLKPLSYYFSCMHTVVKFDIYILINIAFIIALECIKKIAKTILHLALHFAHITVAELITIIVYVGIVWGTYWIGYPLTMQTLLIPLILVLFIEVSFFLIVLLQWYQQLPTTQDSYPSYSLHKRIIKVRLFAYINQLSSLIISGNFLVPLFAYTLGLEYAGMLKLVTSVIHNTTAIIKKITYTSSTMLFALAKNMSIHTKRNLFGF